MAKYRYEKAGNAYVVWRPYRNGPAVRVGTVAPMTNDPEGWRWACRLDHAPGVLGVGMTREGAIATAMARTEQEASQP